MKHQNAREQSRFIRLLENERSFDALFSNKLRAKNATIFYNRNFAEDPVFNHTVIDDALLGGESDSKENYDITLREVAKTTAELSLSASTIFVEKFWKKSSSFQKVAVETGYRVVQQMEVLAKKLQDSSSIEKVESRKDARVVQTEDVDLWNDVFVRSYMIPASWNNELLLRERKIVESKSGLLLLAFLNGIDETPSGCLLLHEHPKGVMGVYCVGTLPSKRSKGIASSILRGSETVAKDSGCEQMTLQTIASDNVTPMYMKLGYSLEFERNLLQTS